mgnify:CR=1 FL=1
MTEFPTFWTSFKNHKPCRSVSRTGACLRDPEAGAPKLGGRGGAGLDMSDLRVPQGRAPRPLEKAGRVGLGYEQTETEIFLFS